MIVSDEWSHLQATDENWAPAIIFQTDLLAENVSQFGTETTKRHITANIKNFITIGTISLPLEL